MGKYTYIERQKRIRNRKFKRLYLRKHPCVDCGEANIAKLTFDHVRGEKTDNISNLINKGKTIGVIKREIAKCDVRCINCHRERHDIVEKKGK